MKLIINSLLILLFIFSNFKKYEVIDKNSTMYGEEVHAEMEIDFSTFLFHKRVYITAREWLFIDDDGRLVECRAVFSKKQLKRIRE